MAAELFAQDLLPTIPNKKYRFETKGANKIIGIEFMVRSAQEI